MLSFSIGIIGGGNLGRSIALGLLESKKISPDHIVVSRRRLHLIEDLQANGIHITMDNLEVIKGKKVIILAVEPHQAPKVLKEIAPAIAKDQMIISVVTGLSIKEIKDIAGNSISVFRAMPNTAIAIRQSMTCISTKDSFAGNEDIVFSIFDQLGRTIKIEEELMNASTVLAACGIAYALRFIRAASQGGIEIGFDAATAQLIAAQTVREQPDC